MRDGGAAFPHVKIPQPQYGEGVVRTYTDGGMSLRDWFAGQALMAIITWEDGALRPSTDAAVLAYDFADAMLAERSKEGREP